MTKTHHGVSGKADIMITERFSRLFSRLLNRWADYEAAGRDPAHVPDLASARVALDEARSEIATERATMISTGPRAKTVSKVAVSEGDLLKLKVSSLGLTG